MLNRRPSLVRIVSIFAIAMVGSGQDSAHGESWLEQEREAIRNVQVPPTEPPPLSYQPPPIVPIEPKYNPDPFGQQARNPPPQAPAVDLVPSAPQPMTPSEIQNLKNLGKNAVTLAPPPPAQNPPISSSKPPAYRQPTVTGFQAPAVAPLPVPPAPGGISLSRAAAAQMPLDITLDASSFSDERIVLSGRGAKGGMDAALLLTAFRVACDRDPYFSLDPDNGALWSQQGKEASKAFWERIKKDFAFSPPPASRKSARGLDIRTVSAARDYSGIWRELSPNYPNFRSKLVFYPEWLRQTRFGEILYKADVLLKELSSGVSVLKPGALRAAQINGYLSSDAESVARTLLAGAQDRNAGQPQWRGSRLWFDVAPSPSLADSIANVERASPSGDPQLRSLLKSRGLVRSSESIIQKASVITRHGDVFDLSQINPRMFVRLHDHVSNKDLSDHDPRLDGLASDVSVRFDEYAAAYEELRLLREVFRAYVVAVQVADRNKRLCQSLVAQPLLNSERIAMALPEYHRSELFVTVANYWTVSRRSRQSISAQASSMNGGVSIAGRQFADTATRDGETGLTRKLADAIAADRVDEPDQSDPDRRYIALVLDGALSPPVQLASNVARPALGVLALRPSSAAPSSPDDDEIENEPPRAIMPAIERNNRTVWFVLLALLVLGFAVRSRFHTRGASRRLR